MLCYDFSFKHGKHCIASTKGHNAYLEEGNKEEYDDYVYVAGVEVEVVPLTEEETGKIKVTYECIEDITHKKRIDT